jgi:hypothetical protein
MSLKWAKRPSCRAWLTPGISWEPVAQGFSGPFQQAFADASAGPRRGTEGWDVLPTDTTSWRPGPACDAVLGALCVTIRMEP